MFETLTTTSFPQSRASRREEEFLSSILGFKTRTRSEIGTILSRFFENYIFCTSLLFFENYIHCISLVALSGSRILVLILVDKIWICVVQIPIRISVLVKPDILSKGLPGLQEDTSCIFGLLEFLSKQSNAVVELHNLMIQKSLW